MQGGLTAALTDGNATRSAVRAAIDRLEVIQAAAAHVANDETLDPERFGRADGASTAYAYAVHLLELIDS